VPISTRKITIEVSKELLNRAQGATANGITETVRGGLQIVAALEDYAQARKLRRKYHFSVSVEEMKD